MAARKSNETRKPEFPTWISLGMQAERWHRLKENLGIVTHHKLAEFLIDCYENLKAKETEASEEDTQGRDHECGQEKKTTTLLDNNSHILQLLSKPVQAPRGGMKPDVPSPNNHLGKNNKLPTGILKMECVSEPETSQEQFDLTNEHTDLETGLSSIGMQSDISGDLVDTNCTSHEDDIDLNDNGGSSGKSPRLSPSLAVQAFPFTNNATSDDVSIADGRHIQCDNISSEINEEPDSDPENVSLSHHESEDEVSLYMDCVEGDSESDSEGDINSVEGSNGDDNSAKFCEGDNNSDMDDKNDDPDFTLESYFRDNKGTKEMKHKIRKSAGRPRKPTLPSEVLPHIKKELADETQPNRVGNGTKKVYFLNNGKSSKSALKLGKYIKVVVEPSESSVTNGDHESVSTTGFEQSKQNKTTTATSQKRVVKYCCTVCGVESKHLSKMKDHVMRVELYNPRICKHCGRQFRNVYALKAHEKTLSLRKIKRYPLAEKKKMMKFMKLNGVANTSKKFKIPSSTLSTWKVRHAGTDIDCDDVTVDENMAMERKTYGMECDGVTNKEALPSPAVGSRNNEQRPREVTNYTLAEKIKMIKFVKLNGVVNTSKTFKIPSSTLSTWKARHADTVINGDEVTVDAEVCDENMALDRKTYTLAEKKKLIKFAKLNGVLSTSKKFKIPTTTIARWKKSHAGTDTEIDEITGDAELGYGNVRMCRKKYTLAEKKKMIKLVKLNGLANTARQFNVLAPTLAYWRKRHAGTDTDCDDVTVDMEVCDENMAMERETYGTECDGVTNKEALPSPAVGLRNNEQRPREVTNYTLAEKINMIKFAKLNGVVNTSKKFKIPSSTLSTWKARHADTVINGDEVTVDAEVCDENMALDRKTYTLAEKKKLIKFAKLNGVLSTSKKFKIPTSTIASWKKSHAGTDTEIDEITGDTELGDGNVRMCRKKYTLAEKKKMIKLIKLNGLANTARQFNVLASTLSYWRKRHAGTDGDDVTVDTEVCDENMAMERKTYGTECDGVMNNKEALPSPFVGLRKNIVRHREITNYTLAEKKKVLKFAKLNGVMNTSKKFKIPLSTLYTWKARHAGSDIECDEVTVEVSDESMAMERKTYTLAEKKKMLDYLEVNSLTNTAKKFKISSSTLFHWRKRYAGADIDVTTACPNPPTSLSEKKFFVLNDGKKSRCLLKYRGYIEVVLEQHEDSASGLGRESRAVPVPNGVKPSAADGGTDGLTNVTIDTQDDAGNDVRTGDDSDSLIPVGHNSKISTGSLTLADGGTDGLTNVTIDTQDDAGNIRTGDDSDSLIPVGHNSKISTGSVTLADGGTDGLTNVTIDTQDDAGNIRTGDDGDSLIPVGHNSKISTGSVTLADGGTDGLTNVTIDTQDDAGNDVRTGDDSDSLIPVGHNSKISTGSLTLADGGTDGLTNTQHDAVNDGRTGDDKDCQMKGALKERESFQSGQVLTGDSPLPNTVGSTSMQSVRYRCTVCGLVKRNLLKLKEHIVRKELFNPLLCQHCGAVFKSLQTFEQHELKHKRENLLRNLRNRAGLFHSKLCQHCGEVLKSLPHLVNHERQHKCENMLRNYGGLPKEPLLPLSTESQEPSMRKKYKTYTLAEKKKVLELAALHGIANMADKLEIPRTTISSWKARGLVENCTLRIDFGGDDGSDCEHSLDDATSGSSGGIGEVNDTADKLDVLDSNEECVSLDNDRHNGNEANRKGPFKKEPYFILNDGKMTQCASEYRKYLEVVNVPFALSVLTNDIDPASDLDQSLNDTCGSLSGTDETEIVSDQETAELAVKYRCKMCRIVSSSLTRLKDHILRKEMDTTHLCHQCGGVFCNEYALQLHELIHEERFVIKPMKRVRDVPLENISLDIVPLKRGKLNTYSFADKKNILELAETYGIEKIADKLRIPRSTVYTWKARFLKESKRKPKVHR